MSQRRIAMIPAYEPGHGFPDLIREINNAGFTVVVVDDGSGEQYADIFKKVKAYARVLTHKENQGKGCALKTGLRYIAEHFPENSILVTMDSDGQHRVGDAVRLCRNAEKNPGALILGSRRMKGNVPIRSRFGNTITRLVYRISTGEKVYDTQTGLRAFSGNLVSFLLTIPGKRYEYEMNVLLESARLQIPIVEMEIETIYMDHNAGSHFDTWKDSYRVYKEILQFSASSFAGFLVDYTLYSLLTLLTAGFPAAVSLRLSNIGARIVSASVNYTINRTLVFKSKNGVIQSAGQYILLAAVILIGNTIVLDFFVNTAGVNRFFAKLAAELIFFSLSWLAQRCLIFRKNPDSGSGQEDVRGR
ncbi:bifunctional glycosyltransferase family 2/GtrA family protein [Cuneatibacter sp. NSJ-177]|uniref:bifunctional glycosyltransferase family 2/GtrA family protein n=1 Tax=Cuneatibacter sp. NSJ-177 TaxID=2931401 RepID=UPI001FD417D6|nr:bifunctional glycosyltransferase family 2/GtrA family protein [Cuneatibacter sp. NSJ-177]MCJ7836770.1 bifunctional glycosyltransferase family 2/GtrA family protein [Cuneatibacter sp. NSJ-177]